jgi:hypothetical protein
MDQALSLFKRLIHGFGDAASADQALTNCRAT